MYQVSSLAYTAGELAGIALEDSVAVVPDTLTGIDRTHRIITLADGSEVSFDILVVATGLQDQTLKTLAHNQTLPQLCMDMAEGAITLTSETDVLAVHRFLHTSVQPGGPRQLDDSHEIDIVCSTTFRTYSVLHSLIDAGVPGKRLIHVHPPMEHNTSLLYHE